MGCVTYEKTPSTTKYAVARMKTGVFQIRVMTLRGVKAPAVDWFPNSEAGTEYRSDFLKVSVWNVYQGARRGPGQV
jgi:hypothetical protein